MASDSVANLHVRYIADTASFQKGNDIAARSAGRVAASLQEGSKSASRFGVVVQQSGYQIQDFAVQVAGGQSAMVAFSQQGSQLLGLFGPAGAIAGAALSVGILVARLFDVGTAANKATKETLSLADAMEKLSSARLEGLMARSDPAKQLQIERQRIDVLRGQQSKLNVEIERTGALMAQVSKTPKGYMERFAVFGTAEDQEKYLDSLSEFDRKMSEFRASGKGPMDMPKRPQPSDFGGQFEDLGSAFDIFQKRNEELRAEEVRVQEAIERRMQAALKIEDDIAEARKESEEKTRKEVEKTAETTIASYERVKDAALALGMTTGSVPEQIDLIGGELASVATQLSAVDQTAVDGQTKINDLMSEYIKKATELARIQEADADRKAREEKRVHDEIERAKEKADREAEARQNRLNAVKAAIDPAEKIRQAREALQEFVTAGDLSLAQVDKYIATLADKGLPTYFDQIDKMLQGIGDRASQVFADMLMDGENAFASLADAVARSIIEITARMALINPILNFLFPQMAALPTFFGPGRATGGPVAEGQAYQWQENGREYFVPDTSGSVVRADRMGGSTPINITYNIASGVSRAELGPILEQNRRRLHAEIPDMVRRGGAYRGAFA